MRFLCLLILSMIALVQPNYAADKNPNNFELEAVVVATVADGWHIIKALKGDLNEDGIDDQVLVVEADEKSKHTVTKHKFLIEPPYWSVDSKEEWHSEEADRALMVFWGQENGHSVLGFVNGDWIDRVDFGGWSGDPFAKIWLEYGAIVIKSYELQPYDYHTIIRIKYLHDKWQIIGYTDMDVQTMPMKVTHVDRNLVTNKVKIRIYKDSEFFKEYWDKGGDDRPIFLDNHFDVYRTGRILAEADKVKLSPEIINQIPKDWHVFDRVAGDLNKDGKIDYVVVVENDQAELHYLEAIEFSDEPPYMNSQQTENWDSMAKDRRFMVFFTQADGTFEHVFSNGNWLGRADFGGTFGDSHAGIRVNNGSIVLLTAGGSRIRWSEAIRIRYEDKKWRMVGYTTESLDAFTIDRTKHDRNLLSYKIQITNYKSDNLVKEVWDEIKDKTKIYLVDMPFN